MKLRQSDIELALAERGRPLMWANEQQAASLSGVGIDRFRAKIAAWEERGFPKVNPENGKRSIPQILAFWDLPRSQANMPPVAAEAVEDESALEKWYG